MCPVIALDVRNSFNSDKWHNIILALKNLEMPKYLRRIMSSYLTERTLLYDIGDGIYSYNITGVPLGSAVGSKIWNVLYDGLLRHPLLEEVSMVAYADNIAVVVVTKTTEETENAGDAAIEVVAELQKRNGAGS